MFETISNIVAAILTLFIFSFLYKENPFYRFAEHLFIGVTMGFTIPLVYENTFIPYVYRPIFLEHQYIYIIPALIGTFYIFRYSKNLNWLSRYPIVLSLALTGMSVPLSMNTWVLVQMRYAMVPIENINQLIIFIGTVTILMYFYFSKAHKGLYGKVSKVGVWYMMIAFGASFGYTVMARISLAIGRIQFLLGDVVGLIK